ncbi:MAG TPA: M48 family metalloprotease [Coriobacteriia bacterium]|nr:M48 family metalloprotease [Coriobacteriia bacterium]
MTTPVAGLPNIRRREPLWDRVDRNRLLLLGHLCVFAVLGAAWFGAVMLVVFLGLAVAGAATNWWLLALPLRLLAGTTWQQAALHVWTLGIVVTLLYEWVALARSERSLLGRLGAEFVPKGERLVAKMALKDMAIAAGMPVAPALYEVRNTNVNAFVAEALGRRPVVGVTSGFLDRLSEAEQRAVFANLVARVRCGDTRVATAITALMAPLQRWRTRHEAGQNASMDREMLGYEPVNEGLEQFPLFFGIPMVVLGEIVAATHRHSQLRTAEKADAEGMLLLKDPPAMLSALERCVELDNVVPTAGEAYGELFYCWTGDSTNDDDDPEWRRVARLREVLGVEGWA